MKKVVVTGGLSSGKSTVCHIFEELGAYVVSADKIVHDLIANNTDVRQKIVDLLGPGVVINGQLNRQAIAQKVFPHPKTLKDLEHILHPLVLHEIELQYQISKKELKHDIFIVEIPLLYETKSEPLFDFVIVVLAEEKLCKKRFCQNKNQKEEDFAERMFRQIAPEKKAAKADFLLLNNGSVEDLKKEVTKLANKIRLTQP